MCTELGLQGRASAGATVVLAARLDGDSNGSYYPATWKPANVLSRHGTMLWKLQKLDPSLCSRVDFNTQMKLKATLRRITLPGLAARWQQQVALRLSATREAVEVRAPACLPSPQPPKLLSIKIVQALPPGALEEPRAWSYKGTVASVPVKALEIVLQQLGPILSDNGTAEQTAHRWLAKADGIALRAVETALNDTFCC